MFLKNKKGLALRNSKGFTLIELLVVVAIIALLASIVMASLNTSRKKGNDAKVKSQLLAVRTAAALYHANNNFTYGNPSIDCNTANTMFTTATGGIGALTASSNYPNPADTTGLPYSKNVACFSNGANYAVLAKLSQDGYSFWCVDSTGYSNQITIGGTPTWVQGPSPNNNNVSCSAIKTNGIT